MRQSTRRFGGTYRLSCLCWPLKSANAVESVSESHRCWLLLLNFRSAICSCECVDDNEDVFSPVVYLIAYPSPCLPSQSSLSRDSVTLSGLSILAFLSYREIVCNLFRHFHPISRGGISFPSWGNFVSVHLIFFETTRQAALSQRGAKCRHLKLSCLIK